MLINLLGEFGWVFWCCVVGACGGFWHTVFISEKFSGHLLWFGLCLVGCAVGGVWWLFCLLVGVCFRAFVVA